MAYALMAEYAQSARNSGFLPAVGKQWDDIPDREQREVLLALACQLRVARDLAQRQAPAQAAVIAGLEMAGLCATAAGTARRLNSDAPGPWVLPACHGCRRGLAGMLCALQYSYYAVAGFSAEMIIAQAMAAAGN